MKKTGINASSGIAIAKAFVYENQEIDVSLHPISDVSAETERLDRAIEASATQIKAIYEKALVELGAEEAAIFDAHGMILEDPEFAGGMREDIAANAHNAEYAVQHCTELFAGMFDVMDDPYFAGRAADIRDVGSRILHNLTGTVMMDISALDEDVILIAEDLTPSDTARMDKNHVRAIATDVGSRTSHTAIMANSLEIPAVLGLRDISRSVQNGDMVIVDGNTGTVICCPTAEELAEYRIRQKTHETEKAELAALKDLPAVTPDGHYVELAANIGNPTDVDGVLRNGGKGIGLFRTEFLYMDSDILPDEEKQFEAYRFVVESFPENGVIIRTMDIGGDKKLPYLPMEPEMNPFLGLRAIRLSLSQRGIFKTQMRAILRASAYGKTRVMFPMISGIEELREAKAVVRTCMDELKAEGIAYDPDLEIGIMVEIPSAAMTADILVQEAAFFSIGTNDLCQYTMAVDRMNEKVAYLYDPLHPAVLRLIRQVISATDAVPGRFTGMCGEMAGDPAAALLLLGMGLNEFSMSAASIPGIKKLIRSVKFEDAKRLAEEALTLQTGEEIRSLAENTLKSLGMAK